jgi:hypothetical protein
MVTYTLVTYMQSDGQLDTVYHSGTSPQPHTHNNGNITSTMSLLGLYQTDATTWEQSVTPTEANSYFTTTGFTNGHVPLKLYIIPEPSGSGGGGGGDTGSTSSGAQGAFLNFSFDYTFELNTVVPK